MAAKWFPRSMEIDPRAMKYVIRYFFDAGSGVCLWAGNDAARAQFGYAIEPGALPLSENTQRRLQHLIAWFDTSLDWDALPESAWSADERERFEIAAQKGFELLRQELAAPQYELTDETGISHLPGDARQ